MDALECIMTRRSIRQFLNIPVDDETKLTIIEAGSCAPSSGNVQGWRFTIIDDKAVMRTMSDYCLGQECIQNAAFLVLVCADIDQTEKHYGLRGERLYSIQDCAAASQNMLLAAHALGLGGVWVGSFDEIKMRSLLSIPSAIRPQSILAFGYPAEVPSEKTKIDLALITFFGRYGLRIKNIHRLTRDYHVEWEKRIHSAHTAIKRLKEKAIENTKETAKKTKEAYDKKGAPWLEHYKNRIKDSFKKKK